LKIKIPKKPKNLTFQGFLGFVNNLKNLGFSKWVSAALESSKRNPPYNRPAAVEAVAPQQKLVIKELA